MPFQALPTFFRILPTQPPIPQSRPTELWVNPTWIVKLELPFESFSAKAEEIKVQLVAKESRPPIEHSGLVKIALAEEQPYHGTTAVFPSSLAVWVNPGAIFAIQSYANASLLYFAPLDEAVFKRDNGTLVIISDARGRFDEDSSPRKVASILGITLGE